MKVKSVRCDNRRKAFEVATARKTYWFPYAKLRRHPSRENPILRVAVDEELGGEGFTYELRSGEEGTIHIEQVLDYNRDPRYMRDLLLYRLTLVARERTRRSRLSTRELIRRLGTSPAQFYRLLDPTNYAKSIDKLLALLSVLDCEVDLVVKKSQGKAGAVRLRKAPRTTPTTAGARPARAAP